jgi:hypothetical protein
MNPYLETLRPVWKGLRHLKVSAAGMAGLETRAIEEMPKLTSSWPNLLMPDDPETFVQFLGVGSALQTALWHPATRSAYVAECGLYEAYGGDTRFKAEGAVWAALRTAVDAGSEILDAKFLMHLTRQRFDEVFSKHGPMPHPEKRLSILRALGIQLREVYDGRFTNVLKAGGWRAYGGSGFLDRVCGEFLAFYDDEKDLASGAACKFLARAHRFAALYHENARGSRGSLRPLEDGEEISPVASEQLTEALRRLEAVRYSEALEAKRAAGEAVAAGTRESIEIRAVGVALAWKIREALRKAAGPDGPKETAHDVSMWLMGEAFAAETYRPALLFDHY